MQGMHGAITAEQIAELDALADRAIQDEQNGVLPREVTEPRAEIEDGIELPGMLKGESE